jgi:lipoprotein-releasing system permease protein
LGSAGLVVWQQAQRNPDGTVMFAVSFEPLMFAMALLLATVTGLIASFAPAMRAARLDPVSAIRG